MDSRYKDLIQRIKDGDPDLMEDLVSKSPDFVSTSRGARDLAEDTLGSEYLRQTGVSVPDIKTASRSQIESFANKLKEEAYPELRKTGIEIPDTLPGGNIGKFSPSTNKISLAKDGITSAEQLAGSTFHEAGHAYDTNKKLIGGIDDFKLGSDKKKFLKSLGIKSGRDLEKLDPSVINEIVQLGHHANIPKLREGSFGLGALKSLVKNKTFKALPFVGPALAGGLTMMATGDASAAQAAATPILGEADDLGPEAGSLEAQVEDPELNREQRQRAIETLLQRNKLGESNGI